MTAPFVKSPLPDISAAPSEIDRSYIIKIIIESYPDIELFRHYWWLTGKPVPPRHDGQTNDQYVSRNWWRLVRAAKDYVLPQIS